MILVLLIGATGLRIVRHSRKVPGKEWFLFGVLLWLCILTRHINAILAGVLPLTFLLLIIFRLIWIRLFGSQLFRRLETITLRGKPYKKRSLLSLWASDHHPCQCFFEDLCYAVKIPYRSMAGPAFLGRLKFLARLPVEKRNQLLDKTSENTNSTDVRKPHFVTPKFVPRHEIQIGMGSLSRKAHRHLSFTRKEYAQRKTVSMTC